MISQFVKITIGLLVFFPVQYWTNYKLEFFLTVHANIYYGKLTSKAVSESLPQITNIRPLAKSTAAS